MNRQIDMNDPRVQRRVGRGIIIAIIALALLLTAMSAWTIVPAGYRGVVLRLGAVYGPAMNEGFNFKMPLITDVELMEVRVQKEQVKTEAASKDMQIVNVEIAANLHPDQSKTPELYQEVGPNFLDRIVAPAMQESIKAILAQYTAEELIAKREEVRDGVRRLLATKMLTYNIIIEDLNIVNFEFSAAFNESIEAKVTAEQNALAAKNKLAQVEFEAQQKVAEAKGKAEAIQIESEALRNNPMILQLRALEKWDGVLPRVTGGGAIPFIDVGAQADLPRQPQQNNQSDQPSPQPQR